MKKLVRRTGIVLWVIWLLSPSGNTQDQNCTCEGQLSAPKTFEPRCEGPFDITFRTYSNPGCKTIEVDEECLVVPLSKVSGSACENLGWTSEFTPIGEQRRSMCWSQVGLPACSELVRWVRLDYVCTQRQCVDCTRTEADEEGNERTVITARWCRDRLWASWSWGQYVVPLLIVCCVPEAEPVEPVLVSADIVPL